MTPPGAVGVDRVLNTLAARTHYGAPVLVVDLGTATTLDAVAADGALVGGAIAPGIAVSLEALWRGAPHLPRAYALTYGWSDGRGGTIVPI